jgi:(2R)-sulfolactate sulfo-lyase subunit alpha
MHKFLVHKEGDHVGVAIQDIHQGEQVEGVYMDTDRRIRVTATDDIPLGHKIALVTLDEGDEVLEYGTRIGVARMPIHVGQHVHVHNIRSARW